MNDISTEEKDKITKNLISKAPAKEIRSSVIEVQKLMMADIKSKLFAKDRSGKTYYDRFLSKYMAEALADPNSRAGQQLASGLINEKMFVMMDKIAKEEANRDIDFKEYRIRKTLYDKQQEVFDDSQDKFILIINSRRSGKTELMGRLLAKRLCRPKQHMAYINRSFDAAARQIEGPLMAGLEACGMDAEMHGTVSGGRVDFTNGSWLLILGNNNIKDVDKLRGEKLSLVILDEVAHQRNMRNLITEVIEPATIDYEDSQIIAVGTPPRVAKTYVEELYKNPKVKVFHWTFLDNPFIPDKENVIKNVCELHGVSQDSAFIRREYLGDMNAFDEDALVIPAYDVADGVKVYKNNIAEDPVINFAWIGVDWGFEDKAAVVTVVASSKYKRAWITECWSESKRTITDVANEVKRQKDLVMQKYKPTRAPWVICDSEDKQGIAELSITHKITNVYGAWKYDRDLAIESLKEYFKTGLFSVCKNIKESAITEDLDATVWKRDPETDQIIREIDDDIHHPNALMAVLYISRQFTYDILGNVTNYNNKSATLFSTDNMGDMVSDIIKRA